MGNAFSVKWLVTLVFYSGVAIANVARANSIVDELSHTEHLAPAARVEKVCGQSESNLCKRLREDPAYRDQYLAAVDQLNRASRATEKAQQELRYEQRQAEKSLQAMRESAVKLPDGTPIFRDKDGKYHKEDGTVVDVEVTIDSAGKVLSAKEKSK